MLQINVINYIKYFKRLSFKECTVITNNQTNIIPAVDESWAPVETTKQITYKIKCDTH